MSDEKTKADKAREHEDTLARIKSRSDAFALSPFWLTAWDILARLLKIMFWLGFWSIIAQCTCSGCIWGKP